MYWESVVSSFCFRGENERRSKPLLLSLGDCELVMEGKVEMSRDTAGQTHVERTQHRSNFPSAPRVEVGDKPKQGRSADSTGMRRGR
jgi:hypothetical protein